MANSIREKLEYLLWAPPSFLKDSNSELLVPMIVEIGYLIGLTHDIGKISPYFQKKIAEKRKELLTSKEIPLSWHTSSGALFTYWTVVSYIHSFKGLNGLMDKILNSFAPLSFLCVANHHKRALTSNIEDIFNIDDLEFLRESLRIVSANFPAFFEEISIPSKLQPFLLEANHQLIQNSNQSEGSTLKETILDLLAQVDALIDQNQKSDQPLSLFLAFEQLFSLLCDADEWDAKHYDRQTGQLLLPMDEDRTDIPAQSIDRYIQQKQQTTWKKSNWPEIIVKLREELYQQIQNQITIQNIGQLLTLTAPTGTGKTLALLNFAMKIRTYYQEQGMFIPRIIYCLPFISIIDQISVELMNILGLGDQIQCKQLTVDHHLASVQWEPLNEDEDLFDYLDIQGVRDYVKLWRSDIVVTTFVKFWYCILNGTKRKCIALNRLMGSIIILDEVQNIPSHYWDVVYYTLKELTHAYGCTIILASATQPLIIPKEERKELVPKFTQLANQRGLSRYELIYTPVPILVEEFAKKLENFFLEHSNGSPKNTMIVMNTKRNARYIYDYLKTQLKNQDQVQYNLYFLSSWVIPKHRKMILDKLNEALKTSIPPVVLVCTQVIEAGIDVSFEIVFRDFAPLDSLIQVAGRCNRHSTQKHLGKVYIQPLKSEYGKNFAELVYQDPISLAATQDVLITTQQSLEMIKAEETPFILSEIELRQCCDIYFEIMKERKNTKNCLREVSRLHFPAIEEKFQLIGEDPNQSLLFLCYDSEAKQILNKIQFQLTTRRKNRYSIDPNFYRYVVNISDPELKNLVNSYPHLIKKIRSPFSTSEDQTHPLFYAIEDITGIYDDAGLLI